jgi:cyclopropane fatty-acyl-phospholipid synthase-like methyltransferase
MINKTLIKSTLNPRLKSIDDYVDNNILKDPIDILIKKYSNDLQDYDYIDSEALFSTLTLKGSMKYINRYDKKLRTGGLLIKIYKKNHQWYAIIKSPMGKKFYVSFNSNYIFYTESKPTLIRSWAEFFVSEVDNGLYDVK